MLALLLPSLVGFLAALSRFGGLCLVEGRKKSVVVAAFARTCARGDSRQTAKHRSWAATSGSAARHSNTAPSWHDIEQQLGEPFLHPPTNVVVDSALNPSEPPPFLCRPAERPILFRERHGWCPYSERVWLTLELCGAAYDTILIDNTGHGPRPSYFAGQTPQIQWPNADVTNGSPGRRQGESMDLVAALDEQYHQGRLLQSERADVRHTISKLNQIFPRSRPSSRAAYLFRPNGSPLGQLAFRETLCKMEDLLSDNNNGKDDDGDYLCGSQLTAADVAYLPFLERYRYQLPCLHGMELQPNDPTQYPKLAKWYQTMDQVPVYAGRIQGNAASWAKVLAMAGYGNDGFPPATQAHAQQMLSNEQFATPIDLPLWRSYAVDRPEVAATPHGQAALIVTRNHCAIAADAAQKLPDGVPIEEVDRQLRELAHHLLELHAWHSAAEEPERKSMSPPVPSTPVISLAQFLDQRMCVPRDMGAMPAACIHRIAIASSNHA